MKKVILSLLSISLLTLSSEVNYASTNSDLSVQLGVLSPQMSTTDIYNYLNTNLGLSAKQKPAVQSAVDAAGSEITKINSDTSKTASETAAAKTSAVEGFIKKLSGSGILNSLQSSKLAGLTSQLTSMFSQLK